MWLPSTTAADQSIAPAALSRSSSAACRRSHTPACCQSPQPSPRGHARAAELARDEPPGDPRHQHEDDRVEGHPIGHARSAGGLGLGRGQERLDRLPHLVADLEDRCHGPPPGLALCQRESCSALSPPDLFRNRFLDGREPTRLIRVQSARSLPVLAHCGSAGGIWTDICDCAPVQRDAAAPSVAADASNRSTASAAVAAASYRAVRCASRRARAR